MFLFQFLTYFNCQIVSHFTIVLNPYSTLDLFEQIYTIKPKSYLNHTAYLFGLRTRSHHAAIRGRRRRHTPRVPLPGSD